MPPKLQSKVDRYFGDAATTDSGSINAALWYAIERYEAEHGIDPTDLQLDIPDND